MPMFEETTLKLEAIIKGAVVIIVFDFLLALLVGIFLSNASTTIDERDGLNENGV